MTLVLILMLFSLSDKAMFFKPCNGDSGEAQPPPNVFFMARWWRRHQRAIKNEVWGFAFRKQNKKRRV